MRADPPARSGSLPLVAEQAIENGVGHLLRIEGVVVRENDDGSVASRYANERAALATGDRERAKSTGSVIRIRVPARAMVDGLAVAIAGARRRLARERARILETERKSI